MVCCPSDLLKLSESWQNNYIWEVCSANWWDTLKTAMPTTSIGQQNGTNSSPGQRLTTCHTTNAPKVEPIGLQSFASSTMFTWPLTNLLILQSFQPLFARKMLPQPAGGRKCFFPRSCWILKHGLLCYRKKLTYFTRAKMCWLYMEWSSWHCTGDRDQVHSHRK